MVNKKINIPEFHLWKLIVFAILITITIIYILELNSTSELKFKNEILEKDNLTHQVRIDSLNKVNSELDFELENQNLLISEFNDKMNYYKNQSTKFKRQYEKSIDNYNALNREQRLQSTKELLHEH